MSDLVTVGVAAGVATLCLNRPEKRNAVTGEMWIAMGRAYQELADDPAVRVLVVRGAGDHFCAGADIAGLRISDPAFTRANAGSEDALADFPKPTIAFIRGSCVGGGVQIAAACDLRIADSTARLGVTPARLGIIYPAGALTRLVKLIGSSAAKHLLFSAELIDADRALRIGLLDEVHVPADAEARLSSFVSLLADQRSQLTQQASKAMIDAVLDRGRIEPDLVARWATEMRSSGDPEEGIAAFLQRRSPTFTWSGPSPTPPR